MLLLCCRIAFLPFFYLIVHLFVLSNCEKFRSFCFHFELVFAYS
jgi:hypothetical protein